MTSIHIYAVKPLAMEPMRLFKVTKAEKPSRANELTYILSSGFSCGLTTQQPGKQLGKGVRGSVREREGKHDERKLK